MLLHHVRLAAARGVRVRMLVDDLNTAGEDRRFMHLSEHANIEVRVFNPFPGGRSADLDPLPRLGRRTYRASIIACTTSCSSPTTRIAITGGRNIGDQYFTRDQHSNFIDLDVVAAGAIVPQLSASFDAFWNSKYAYPIASLASPVRAEEHCRRRSMRQARSAEAGWLARELDADALQLTWVPATVLADKPAKIASDVCAGRGCHDRQRPRRR